MITDIKTALLALTEVSSLNEWKGRTYVNFAGSEPGRMAGDRALKIWFAGDVLTIEPYRGSLSDGARRGLNQITDLTAQAEKISGHSSETAGRYRFG